jgi:hypothetical protein
MPTESTLQFPALNLSPRVSAALGKIIDARLKEIQTATDFFNVWQRASSPDELIGLIYYLGHLLPTMMEKIRGWDCSDRYRKEKIEFPSSVETYLEDVYELMSFLSALASWDDSINRHPDWQEKELRAQKSLQTWLGFGDESSDLTKEELTQLQKVKAIATTVWYKILFSHCERHFPNYLSDSLKDRIGFMILNHFARYAGDLDPERNEYFSRITNICWDISLANWQNWGNKPENLLTVLLALGKTDQLHRLLREDRKYLIPAWIEFCHQLGELPENNWDENNPGAIVNSPQAQKHERHHYESFLAYLCRLIRICYFK